MHQQLGIIIMCVACCAVQALLLPGHTEFEPPCACTPSTPHPTTDTLPRQHQHPPHPGTDLRLHPAVLEARKAVAQRLREAHARKLQVGGLAAWDRWGKRSCELTGYGRRHGRAGVGGRLPGAACSPELRGNCYLAQQEEVHQISSPNLSAT